MDSGIDVLICISGIDFGIVGTGRFPLCRVAGWQTPSRRLGVPSDENSGIYKISR
jgi:hypothetical protein